MEATIEKKKGGNPNFRKKEVIDTDKTYEYELIKTHLQYKPTDENGNKRDNPYPPIYGLPNKGVAYCEETKRQRAWRYIRSEESIWIDKQRELTSEEEAYILSDMDNQLDFVKGKLRVEGIEKNKIAAIEVQDAFEGKVTQLKKGKPRTYRLLNPDTAVTKTLETLDEKYLSISKAREATIEEMYEVAHALGINLNQKDEFIKKDFYLAAETNPSYFLKQFVNPKNKYAYMFSTALQNGTLTSSRIHGQLLWAENDAFIMEVNSSGDVAMELATKAILGDEKVVKVYHQLAKL